MRVTIQLAILALSPLGAAAQTPTPQSTTLPRASAQDSITVTADRGLPGITDNATSIVTLTPQQLQQSSGLTLDDRLHSVAGFQLFRRTSSWTANPTTEGVSLRGLGSTAASRTLVESDQVPLNDPFGGWVHWDELPTLAIQQVSLLRGGSANLYGSSAIGGVIAVTSVTPTPHAFTLAADAAGATESTALGDALLTTASHALATLGAFSALATGGYIPTAPASRGTVDIPSNVFQQSGRVALFTPPQSPFHAFLLGNLLNEARGNGTPLQTNGTRLWRYLSGLDLNQSDTHESLRLFGSREAYRQSFSSIAANRDSETLTKLQRVPTDELGLSAQATHALPRHLTAALGFDLHDIRATDDETATATAITTSTTARQRETGGYFDAIWQPKHWSLSGSLRVDSFRTFNAQQVLSSTAALTPLPTLNELFASPRLGLVRTLPHGLALTATAFRAFRGPTMNELYRTGQVGQQTTLANNSLLAERATGFEFGGEYAARLTHLRATYFWTEVNRPISAVLLSQTAATQLLQRQNLGQIRSRGLMLEAQTARWHALDTTFGYQLAIATVTAFNSSSPAQANLTGNWLPEVPRQSLTATANYVATAGKSTLLNVHLIASYTGRTYDDAANQFLLHPYARFDLSADRTLTHGLSLYASAQNLLNRTIDAGETPILTLAAPRLVQAGLRYTFSR